jgi:predicted ATPase/DNA-binding XRE family transcriptional regulator/tetratricopeptide (TPR) repeat protein
VSSTLEFAALLKQFRLRAGLSQQMLADRALISVQAISALERGYRKVPYRKTLERLADALSLSDEARAALELSARRVRGSRSLEYGSPPHNLPRQLTSFVGRDEVVEELAALVSAAPLISLVGTGGAGKTRTAIAVATKLLDQYADGVWFVELAPLNDETLVVHALAAALRVQESSQHPLLTTLLSYLAEKQLLIIFDNCEHVIGQARRTVGSLLRDCPGTSLLVTSRQPLTISGERVYRQPPLAVPGTGVSAREAFSYGAVALFADRVQAADAQFAVTEQNVAPVVEICRRLEGLPLALELAAARATVLSPWQIAERLDRVFDLLTGTSDTTIPRHQTMRAVINWSYALLSSQARLLFDRLSVFASGFTLETATGVCVDEQLEEGDILELLGALIAQSLVVADFSLGMARYHMLEVTRQFAVERATERGERETLSRRHAETCLSVAERLDREWYTAHERTWFDDAVAEIDNFRTTLAWSLAERHDLRTGQRLAGALARIWYSLSPVEGRRWVRLALQSINGETQPSVVAELHIAEARLSGALGEYKASLAAAERALKNGAPLDDLQTARAREVAGSALTALGRGDEGEVLLAEALATARRLGNRGLEALLLGDLGTARSRRGDVDGARSFYAEALAHYLPLGLERPAASIAGHLAEVEFAAGDAAAALQRAEEARIGHEATHNRRSAALDLCNMAAYLVALDCFDDAKVHASRALANARDVKATALTALILQHFAAVGILRPAAARGPETRETAAMLLGFVDARLAALEAAREHTERQEYERVIAALTDQFGERLSEVMALGAQWDEETAIAAALDL